MAQWVVVEREAMADDARAFRTLIAEMARAEERAQTQSQATFAIEDGCLESLATSAVRSSHRLTTQLLAYACSQALTPARLEPLPLLCDLAQRLRHALDARIDVLVDVGHDCPSCHADPLALEEALLNLIANARDAMPDGGRLCLRAHACELPDARPGVEISVSDSGMGMSAEAMGRAGQPFFTSKIDLPLAGMGLAATNGFAVGSGGVLALHSPPWGGLTAALRLPQPSGA